MVNSVSFGSGAATGMTGGYDSIAESTRYLTGGGHGSGDVLDLSTHKKKRPSMETVIKGALAATVGILGFRFFRGRKLAKAAKA